MSDPVPSFTEVMSSTPNPVVEKLTEIIDRLKSIDEVLQEVDQRLKDLEDYR